MKILHVVPSIAKEEGGPSKAVIEMCKEQNKQGIKSDILTTHKNNKRKVKNQKVYSFKSYLGYKYSPKLKKWLKNNISGYDLLHIHTVFCYTTYLAAKQARRTNTPYIIRTIGQLYPWCLNQKKLKKKIYLELIERKNLENASLLHFTTEDEKENMGINIENDSYILPLGIKKTEKIRKEKFNELFPKLKDKKIILFLSRIHPKKGLDLSISSLERILKNKKEWVLVIAGDGPKRYVKKIKNLVEKLDLVEKVKFTGFVGGDKKQALLQNSEIFILPSHSENFGISVIEAMQSGTTVATSNNVGVYKDIKKENAGEVFSLDEKEIRESIRKLINNSKIRKKQGKKGKKIVKEKYSWNKITKKQINIYKNIIKNDNL